MLNVIEEEPLKVIQEVVCSQRCEYKQRHVFSHTLIALSEFGLGLVMDCMRP